MHPHTLSYSTIPPHCTQGPICVHSASPHPYTRTTFADVHTACVEERDDLLQCSSPNALTQHHMGYVQRNNNLHWRWKEALVRCGLGRSGRGLMSSGCGLGPVNIRTTMYIQCKLYSTTHRYHISTHSTTSVYRIQLQYLIVHCCDTVTGSSSCMHAHLLPVDCSDESNASCPPAAHRLSRWTERVPCAAPPTSCTALSLLVGRVSAQGAVWSAAQLHWMQRSAPPPGPCPETPGAAAPLVPSPAWPAST